MPSSASIAKKVPNSYKQADRIRPKQILNGVDEHMQRRSSDVPLPRRRPEIDANPPQQPFQTASSSLAYCVHKGVWYLSLQAERLTRTSGTPKRRAPYTWATPTSAFQGPGGIFHARDRSISFFYTGPVNPSFHLPCSFTQPYTGRALVVVNGGIGCRSYLRKVVLEGSWKNLVCYCRGSRKLIM